MPDQPYPTAIKLSAVIITRNEEKNIARCLESIQGLADDVLVLDSGSNDKTRMITARYSVRFFSQPFQGYAAQKNDAAKRARFNYVLSLDADEALSEPLKDAIRLVKEAWTADAYAFNRLTRFCGTWIHHGEWYPDRVVRLYDKRKTAWQGTLHEELRLPQGQPVEFLHGDLLHYSYDSLFQYHRKTVLYAGIAAADLFAKGLRPRAYHFFIKPIFRFFNAFIIQRGFLDGSAGYRIACLTAGRLQTKYTQLKRLRQQGQNKQGHHGL